jgi:hypothetical protein
VGPRVGLEAVRKRNVLDAAGNRFSWFYMSLEANAALVPQLDYTFFAIHYSH